MTEEEAEKLLQENRQLKEQLAHMEERVNQLLHALYAPKTEKTKRILKDGGSPEGSLFGTFNEAEQEARLQEPEPEAAETAVKAHTRRKKTPRALSLENLPIENVPVDIPEAERSCKIHPGVALVQIGEEVLREEIVLYPARLVRRRFTRPVYQCPACRKEGRFGISKADAPASLLPHSIASPSLASRVLAEKFLLAVPFHRQEKEWAKLGLPLSRATMANWAIALHKYYIAELVRHMHARLLEAPVLHADETTVQVHREGGGRSNRKNQLSYMWLYATSPPDKASPAIRIFDYQPSRSGDCAKKFLGGFRSILVHDQYKGYDKLPVEHAGCWAHLRRKFFEAMEFQGTEEKAMTIPEYRDGNAGTAIRKMREIFAIEGKLQSLDPEERKKQRIQQERPLVEAFFAWAENLRREMLPKGKLAAALDYALKAKDSFCRYLEDGRVPMTNNPAENAIRPFTVGRKNWLFSDSPRGAAASAAIYSLIETSKANGLEPEKYLCYIFSEMPGKNFRDNPEMLEGWMPWSNGAQDNCKA